MAKKNGSSIPKQAGETLVITRVFNAPRKLVWKTWSEPERLMRWWGPKFFTAPSCKVDFRVGGTYLFCMRSPDGKDYWSTGVYREIVDQERIVYTDCFADERGNVVPAMYYGFSENFPRELLVRLTFEEHDGKTTQTLKHAGFPPGNHLNDARAGWNGSFDKLAEILEE
nr:SRPBCC domain-containing protein [Candidatus Sigynarchaeota archaeon]